MDATVNDLEINRQRKNKLAVLREKRGSADDLEVSRKKAEKKLADLRAQRGAALLDGKAFDHSRITAAESELAAYDEAVNEAERRDAVRVAESGRAAHFEAIDAYAAVIPKRVAAVGALEAATRALGDALAAVLAVNEEERLAVSHLTRNPEGDLTPVNYEARLWGMMRGVLRVAVGRPRFGPVDLSPFPGDLDPAASWSEHEVARGTMIASFRRLAPE